ncbi:hypothetical protein RF11_04619 [Thelohanellus kitauei]|uniref:Uncharacterized protein n=1 Tax=Thelohanellus kitauei TaxID=669202 RepID=A0A0C2J1B5_THEKT|nr:hypothetical protein RF11_04619 [Thelohanellus kitauei]
MSFLVYICLLALRFSLSCSAKCGIDFGDRDGATRHKLLGLLRIPSTIHGEWTHCATVPKPGDTVCQSVAPVSAVERRLWFTSVSNTNAASSPNFWLHECEKHRGPRENGNTYKLRVISTCTKMEGYLSKIWCRPHKDGDKNVVYQVRLNNWQVGDSIKENCNINLPFFTPHDLQIKTNPETKHKWDIITSEYTRIEPGASGPVVICYKCKKD